MMPKYLSAMWTAIALALGNHLWQSTLFAVTAGLLTLILRKNRARVRYWLWLAASVKFLIPFSLLAGIGSHLAWSRGSVGTNAGWYFAMEEVSQPFTQPTVHVISWVGPSTVSLSLVHLLPVLLTAAWLCGFVAVLLVWFARWRRISAALREAAPLREGREVEALRRLERIGVVPKQIEMVLSRTSLEPGIFGIVRPVLVWPEAISERLEDAHLEAILAHEVWHVRRRDNLAAAIHMAVQAVFWFHPLVWWLGARLVEERERACDEQVLESGSDRQVYAESILKICEFCVEPPLAFVSGVTGADLKKRIAHIMTEGVMRKLDFSRKLLLSAAGLLAVALPILYGLLNTMQTRAASLAQNTTVDRFAYESIVVIPTAIKPDKSGNAMTSMLGGPDSLTATNVTLQALIENAYGVQQDQVSGAPDWLNSEKYDVEAKIDKVLVDELQKLSPAQRSLERRRMLQAILADHFKLSLHRETKDLPVYELLVANNAPKLQVAKPGDTYAQGIKGFDGLPLGAGRMFAGDSQVVGQGVAIPSLVAILSGKLRGRIVLDKTGLTGKYDFTLDWTSATSPSPASGQGTVNTPQPNFSATSISVAMQEQLGLKLEPQTVPMEVLVIDHAEMPTESQAQNAAVAAPGFAVASIKPNNGTPMTGFSIVGKPFAGIMWKADRFMATNFTLHKLILRAYDVQDDQILGGPAWLNSEGYDTDAKMEKSVVDEMQRLGPEQRVLQSRRMLQALLADRFKLSLHSETKEVPVYAMVIAGNGLKIQRAIPGDTYPNGFKRSDGVPIGAGNWSQPGEFVGQGAPIASLVQVLSEHYLHRAVLDKTGLIDKYDFTLQWTPPESHAAIFTAIEEQLGLKLESQKGSMQVLVIDHAEKPLEN